MQVHRNPDHVVDQHVYRMESLLVLKQPSFNVFFRLEMNVGGIPEHQNKTLDTNRYKGYFSTARVRQVDVNNMKRTFDQRSELQVAKCLLVHVLSSSYSVSTLELPNKTKAAQQWCLRVAKDIVLNQVRVYH